MCCSSPRRRGFSLLETLIAVAVGAVLLTLLTQILIPGFRIWKQTRAVADIEHNARQAEAALRNAFLPTCAYSVTTLNAPDLQAVSFLDHGGSAAVGSYDPVEGRAYWRHMTIFKHVPGQDRLEQSSWTQAPLPTTSAFFFDIPQLRTACANPNARKVAEHVKSFEVQQPAGKHFRTFTLELEAGTPTGPHTLHHEFAMTPRTEASP